MSDVVCFRLINGSEIVGKRVEEKNHLSFVAGEDVIYLDDAIFIGISQGEGQQARLGFGPISGIAEAAQEGKAHIPFALYRHNILGQIPLDPEISRVYREATSGIALVR